MCYSFACELLTTFNPDDVFWQWCGIWLNPRFLDWNIEDQVREIHVPLLGSKAALEYTLEHVLSDSNFLPAFKRLLPADQAILKLLANGESDVYSENTRRRVGIAIGTEQAITKGTSSAALKRLQEGGLILKFEHGLYQIQDDALADWLRNQELDE